MRRAYKFRLYPNTDQERELGIALETHRRLWNACLDQRKTAWETEKRPVRYVGQSAWFKVERTANPYFARLNFSSAQATMRRLDKAFVAFFRRCKSGGKPGYPRFKSCNRYDSIEFPTYGDGIRLNDNRLRVQHVGIVKAKIHREIEGRVKTATVKREGSKWFVILSCELPDADFVPNGKPAVGIDVGIEAFLTTSDGERVENPRFLRREIPQLRRLQRSISRKKRSSKNRRKAVYRIQALHARVRNLRHNFHHKTALHLVRSSGLVAVERLNIRGMLRNHRLAQAISDVAWGGFVNILNNKAASAGCEVVAVNARGTSQECNGCGATVQKTLSVRQHVCPSCKLSLHRDENAARNVLARALLARTGPAGINVQRDVA